jgi:hypothetical protein
MIEWSEDKTGDYATAWNDAHSKKDSGWRLPSPQELMDAAQNKTPGFIDEKYYWTNDWKGDPSHAGAIQMYSGLYYFGMPCFNNCNYKLIKET